MLLLKNSQRHKVKKGSTNMWKRAALFTWVQLNQALKDCTTVDAARSILDEVIKHNGPESFVERVKCRIRALERKNGKSS